jgi:hypothetical protein
MCSMLDFFFVGRSIFIVQWENCRRRSTRYLFIFSNWFWKSLWCRCNRLSAFRWDYYEWRWPYTWYRVLLYRLVFMKWRISICCNDSKRLCFSVVTVSYSLWHRDILSVWEKMKIANINNFGFEVQKQ